MGPPECVWVWGGGVSVGGVRKGRGMKERGGWNEMRKDKEMERQGWSENGEEAGRG